MSYSLNGGYPGDYAYSFEDSWNISQSPEDLFINDIAVASRVPGYRTLNVSGRESMSYTITEEDRPVGMDGTEYFGRNMDGRTITVRFLLKRNDAVKFMESYEILKRVCTESEELKISFSDQPNCYYTGVLRSVAEPSAGSLKVVGSMEFYCSDPYLYEDLITTVKAKPEYVGSGDDAVFNSHLSAKIINDGSGKIFPVYKIKNDNKTSSDDGHTYTSQNSYIGIVHRGGALELGDPEENNSTRPSLFNTQNGTRDGDFSMFVPIFDTANKRVHPFDKRCSSKGTLGLTHSAKFFPDSEVYPALTIQNSVLDSTSDLTYGGMRRVTLDDPAPDFYLWCQLQAVCSQMGQTGLIEVMLCDEDDKFLAGIGIVKDDFSGNTARFVIWVNELGEFKKFNFTSCSNNRGLNPFIDRGYEDIWKNGGKWRFYYGGKYYTTYVPEQANKSVKYVYLYCGRFVRKTKNNKSNDVNIRYLNAGKIRANDMRTNNWQMIGNRFIDNDEIVIDTQTDSITLDGLPANDQLVTGSVFAPIPPSQTYVDKDGNLQYEPITVDIYTSSWQDYPPTVEIEYRRRWL